MCVAQSLRARSKGADSVVEVASESREQVRDPGLHVEGRRPLDTDTSTCPLARSPPC